MYDFKTFTEFASENDINSGLHKYYTRTFKNINGETDINSFILCLFNGITSLSKMKKLLKRCGAEYRKESDKVFVNNLQLINMLRTYGNEDVIQYLNNIPIVISKYEEYLEDFKLNMMKSRIQ